MKDETGDKISNEISEVKDSSKKIILMKFQTLILLNQLKISLKEP